MQRQVELSADRTYIKNDGDDMVFVEATIEDNTGIMVPGADNRITFDVEGGEIVSVDNGDPRDHDPYKKHRQPQSVQRKSTADRKSRRRKH